MNITPANAEHRAVAMDAVLVKAPVEPTRFDGDLWVNINRWTDRATKIMRLIDAGLDLVDRFFRSVARNTV